jgi:hypothetical protein
MTHGIEMTVPSLSRETKRADSVQVLLAVNDGADIF